MCAKDLFKSKYQLPINGREKIGTKKWKIPKGFIDYSQIIDDVYEDLEEYNPTKKRKKNLIVFDDLIADMETNRKVIPIITEFFLRYSIFHSFYITILLQSAKNCKIIHDTWKCLKKKELQQIALNHLSNIESKDFMKLYKDYTENTIFIFSK